MPDAAAKPPSPVKENAFGSYIPAMEVPPFGEFSTRNLAAAAKANTAVLKGATTYWAHLSDFVGRRLKADADLVRELNSCRNGEDAMRIHHRFSTTMVADYVGEMQELMSIGAEIARNLVEPIEERAGETLSYMEERNQDAA